MPEEKSLDRVEYIRLNDGVHKSTERVVVEFNLSISVNGTLLTTTMITPMMKNEFVVGYLFGQGIINSISDIESITVSGDSADVRVAQKISVQNKNSKIDFELKISREDIFSGINMILKSDLYAETSAIHSAGLFKAGAEVVCIAEDVGRHNALDKVIGHALINEIDFGTIFAASTGRMVSDMVSKICRATIPIVATKTAVTKQGMEIGEKHGLTIIGFVRDAGTKLKMDTYEKITTTREMKIYTNPHRIT